MNIMLNGKKEVVQDNITIQELLKEKNIRSQVVTVELNNNIIKRGDFPKIEIKEKDTLEFVYFMGGGKLNSYSPSRN